MGNLKNHIMNLIGETGPISVAQYMEICMTHPEMGYYTTRDPFGQKGDFTTAPEISQVFGELIGLFFADYWLCLKSPKPVHFIELGPGRGTLMADVLRAIKIVPELLHHAEIHFVEISPELKKIQANMVPIAQQHDSLDEIPPGTSFIIANEFFDVLPIRQFVYSGGRWAERMVTQTNGQLEFTLNYDYTIIHGLPQTGQEGEIWESAPQANLWISTIAQRINAFGGLGLIVDYGYADQSFGNSFQAVQKQSPVDVLKSPGESDLTAHVNFEDLIEKAKMHDLEIFGFETQGNFLKNLGIDHRASQLLQDAKPEQKKEIESAIHRLVSEKEMGNLFKVLCLGKKNSPVPAGFEKIHDH